MGMGKFQLPPLHKINTPEPIDKKIGIIDYLREGTNLVEIHKLRASRLIVSRVWSV